MKKAFIMILAVISVLGVSGCSRNPCRKLASQVCEKAAGSEACKAAGTLTAADECEDYLVNLDRFIEIKNTPVTTERLAPPTPAPAPAAEAVPQADAAPAAEGGQVPATDAPAAVEAPATQPTQAAPAPATTP